MNEIQYLITCAKCDDEGLTQKLGIDIDEDDWLTIGCQNHNAPMQELELKQPVMIEGGPCTKCAEKVRLDIGFTGDRVIVTCKEHGTLIGAFELAEPVTLKCPHCGEGAVGSHTH